MEEKSNWNFIALQQFTSSPYHIIWIAVNMMIVTMMMMMVMVMMMMMTTINKDDDYDKYGDGKWQ